MNRVTFPVWRVVSIFAIAEMLTRCKECFPLAAKSSSKLGILLAYSYLYDFVKKILALAEKSSSKLDFSLAYSYLCRHVM